MRCQRSPLPDWVHSVWCVELAVQTIVSIPFNAASSVGRVFRSPTMSVAPADFKTFALSEELSRTSATTFLPDAVPIPLTPFGDQPYEVGFRDDAD